MFKPCFALCFASLAGLLLASSIASAQMGGPASASPLGNIFKNNNANTSNRSSTQHELKSAEAGLGDADPRVRVEALRKLRNVKDPEADFLLIRAMSDPDTRVRVKAIDILGGRDNADAVAPMCQFLFLRSTEPVVKMHVAAALGRIGDARAAKPLIQFLYEATDENSRGTAVFALGEIGDHSANDVLTTAATEDPSPTVRRLAQQAIQKINGEIPTGHPVTTAKQQMVPTDQRLSKLRELDQQLNKP
ncbi:MAG TPA: HEAT repeat domain-containing protein [Candidatus Binataceae bacterium]|jgi:HEAT repeat protein|nr:HEAT repeat domain-containing protein [Candidatus Binataceae bacterium]